MFYKVRKSLQENLPNLQLLRKNKLACHRQSERKKKFLLRQAKTLPPNKQ